MIAAFEGWNDAGESATSALRYLAAAIRSVPVAEIDGEEFLDFTVRRPWVRFGAGGERVIDWPGTRFRFGPARRRASWSSRTASSRTCGGAATAICSPRWCARLRVQRVVLLGAYVADVVYSRPVEVTGFASETAALESIGVPPSSYEGPTGIVGVLGERLQRDGVEVITLWAGLPHYISASPNPRGALALLQKLESCMKLAIDLEPLRREAAAFEEKISALVAADPSSPSTCGS